MSRGQASERAVCVCEAVSVEKGARRLPLPAAVVCPPGGRRRRRNNRSSGNTLYRHIDGEALAERRPLRKGTAVVAAGAVCASILATRLPGATAALRWRHRAAASCTGIFPSWSWSASSHASFITDLGRPERRWLAHCRRLRQVRPGARCVAARRRCEPAVGGTSRHVAAQRRDQERLAAARIWMGRGDASKYLHVPSVYLR